MLLVTTLQHIMVNCE